VDDDQCNNDCTDCRQQTVVQDCECSCGANCGISGMRCSAGRCAGSCLCEIPGGGNFVESATCRAR
jgi:hypothetical protein